MPLIQTFLQLFTANGSWTAPANLVPGSVQAYSWGPSGTAANGVAFGNAGGGGGSGSLGGESALGGVNPGTVLTATVPAGGSGSATTITGGSVTVTGNPGGNASGTTGGAAGTAPGNTLSRAGAAGGTGGSGAGGTGGGGGGSPGTTGAGGAGTSGASGGAGGTAGTGPPSLAGAAGGNGGAAGGTGGAGTAPGSGPGGGGGNAGGAGAAARGQAVIIWSVYIVPAPPAIPRRRLARAWIQSTPAATTNAAPAPPVTGTIQPATAVPAPRRRPARAWLRFTPVTTANATPRVAGTIQPRATVPVPRRRRLARAFTRFTPVATTNATVTRTLLISLASRAGTDDYGNSFPQGILATAGVIEGPTIIGSDAFFYNGAPAFGTLTQSITEAAGTDQFGNAYLQGTTTYSDNGTFWSAVSIANGVVTWYEAGGPGGPWNAEAGIGFSFNGITGGGITISASAGISGAINIPQAGVSGSIATLPTDNNSGTTWVSGERAFMNNSWVSNINNNFAVIIAALQNAGIIT